MRTMDPGWNDELEEMKIQPVGDGLKFTDDEEYLQKELKNAFPRVNCLELIPEHMTGKLVNES